MMIKRRDEIEPDMYRKMNDYLSEKQGLGINVEESGRRLSKLW